jgi:hypothetical protein
VIFYQLATRVPSNFLWLEGPAEEKCEERVKTWNRDGVLFFRIVMEVDTRF